MALGWTCIYVASFSIRLILNPLCARYTYCYSWKEETPLHHSLWFIYPSDTAWVPSPCIPCVAL